MLRGGSRFFLLVLCLFQLHMATADAVTQEKIAATTGTNDDTMQNVSLSRLQIEPGAIRLTGPQSQAILSIPVSARQHVSDMTLTLFITNSISLVNRSQLAVSMNGSVVGQVAFKADAPETHVRMTIPASLLINGYNKLSFSVAQHYSDRCEDPTAPELWSEIDTVRSNLTYKVTPQPITPTLADLPLLMDKRLSGDYKLAIATTASPDDALVESGGLVAEAAALSRDYAPLSIRHVTVTPPQKTDGQTAAILAEEPFGGSDAVVLGSRDELGGWLSPDAYRRAAEPLLVVLPLGPDREHFVLIVTGADHQQVRQAAATLATAYATLPPAAQANVKEIASITLPDRPTLISGTQQPFSSFGFHTVTRQGIHPESIRIRFWVPADRFAQPNSDINVHLHMAYGAGLGPQSTADLYLNDHFEQAIRLTEKSGAVYYDYRLPIPITSLMPGWNELTLQPNLLPEREGGECRPTYVDNLLLTLFDDSYLVSDEMGHLAQLPDLKLLARTAFPFAGARNTQSINVALTSRSSGNLSAAWTLLAKLAQVNNSAILELHASDVEHAKGNLLLVGQPDQLPENLRSASALRHNGWLTLGTAPYASGANAASLKQESGAMDVSLGDILQHSILLTQFESPMQSDKSVVMAVSDSPALLAEGVNRLTDGALWGQLSLGTAVLRLDSDKVLTYEAPSHFLVGDAGSRARLSFIFDRYPVIALVAVIGAILLFALFTWWMLKRYRRHHHQGQGV